MLCNQATVDHELVHVLDRLLPEHAKGRLKIQAVFGPQHGLYGHTQDNMIEWEPDPRRGLVVRSLYGKDRQPTDEMLEGIELFVIDITDVGARYYTFVWTMCLCIEACAKKGIPVLVLDRPNPIGGLDDEGTVLDPGFTSFVGLHPIPTRHGLTAGEIATFAKQRHYPDARVDVVSVQGWSRSDYFDDLDLPWVMPSPNMPTVDTAVVYPGGCLLEGTNLSEGRGTTRPFEMFGAPWLDGWRLAEALNALDLAGCTFRPVQFEPTFQKHAQQVCEGCFLHVTDRHGFEPVLAHVAILQEAVRQAKAEFEWKAPPYEYEYEKLPIDILAGNAWLRPAIEELRPLNEIRQRFLAECASFESIRRECLLYP